MKKEYIPFTYRVTCIPTGQHYYGVRTAAGCHPDDFWVSYFTSSDKVKSLIEEHGKDSFQFEIRRKFPNNPKAAIDWEVKVLKRLKIPHNLNWLNQAAFPSIALYGENNPMYGKKFSEEHRKKLSEALSRRKLSEETRKKLSESKMGENNPFYGKKFSEEHRKKLSEAHLGKKLSEETRKKLREAHIGEKNHNWGKTHSEETRKKLREANLGKKRSEETRRKVSESKTGKNNPNWGKKRSEETRRKMSEALSGENHPFYGKKLSPESIRKREETKRKKRISRRYGMES